MEVVNNKVYERMLVIQELFEKLQEIPGRNDKNYEIVKVRDHYPYISDDLDYCFEIIAGKHKLGYTLTIYDNRTSDPKYRDAPYATSIKEFCEPLFQLKSKSELTLQTIGRVYEGYGWFLMPLFNREWRLGVNKSQLDTEDITPMLAKKFEIDKVSRDKMYFITEKLDGNRCIARYNGKKSIWEFFSRSGKFLKVSFDMKGLPVQHIYDGEILSLRQIKCPGQTNFNALSGIVNSKNRDKSELVYTIFDIIEDSPYYERREKLTIVDYDNCSSNVLVLPVLDVCDLNNLENVVSKHLEEVTSAGGEGVMINLGSRHYEHKRTDALLKVKDVFTMDMKVLGLKGGTGKNEGLVGALICQAEDKATRKLYMCQVGSGLSDLQRTEWAYHPENILNKIVEVAYFSASQDRINQGTKVYSLRFPRLKRVRDDKDTTSVH